MTVKDIVIDSGGRRLHGRLFTPREQGPLPAVLICHGYNGCGEMFYAYCEYLAHRGITAMAITFCGGSTRDESGFPSTSMTMKTERDDAIAGIEYLRNLPYTDKNRVFLFGESMGGLAATMAASELGNRIAGLFLLYPAFCIATDWKRRVPGDELPETVDFWGLKLGRPYLQGLREFDVYDLMPGITVPVTIFHGHKDAIVPISYARRAADAFPFSRLILFPEEGHGFSAVSRGIVISEVAEDVLTFS